MQKIV
jgi:hypothetical protein